MKTWLLNPRTEEVTARGRSYTVTRIDCPCGCTIPFVLQPIAAVTFPAVGTVLSQLQWRLLLNNYTVPGRVHRVVNGASGETCGWAGRIVAGRIFSRDDAGEDDTPFGRRVADTLAWLRERGDLSVR
jgi:hypothetical protein